MASSNDDAANVAHDRGVVQEALTQLRAFRSAVEKKVPRLEPAIKPLAPGRDPIPPSPDHPALGDHTELRRRLAVEVVESRSRSVQSLILQSIDDDAWISGILDPEIQITNIAAFYRWLAPFRVLRSQSATELQRALRG